MKQFLVLILVVLSVAAQAQGQKPVQKPAATTPTPTPQEKGPTLLDLMTEHYARKNSLASRWNDNDIARASLYDLIALYPGNDSLLYVLAADYYNTQQYVSAVLVAQDLLSRDPKNIDAMQVAASGFEAINLYDKALPHYESMYLQTNSTTALYKMAVLQYDLKKFMEAKTNVDILLTKPDIESLKVMVTDSEKKQKEYSFKVSLLNLKGLLAQQAGDKVAAKKAYEEALSLAPDFPLAKANLAKLK